MTRASAPEAALPEPVAGEDGHRKSRLACALGRRKGASENGAGAEHRQEIGGDAQTDDLLRARHRPSQVPVPTSSSSMSSKDRFCSFQSRKLGADGPSRLIPSFRSVSQDQREAIGAGDRQGTCSSTELTTLKIAVFAPIPIDSTSTATMLKPGHLCARCEKSSVNL